ANEHWSQEDVNGRLRARLFSATDAMVERWRRFPPGDAAGGAEENTPRLDLRTAALVEAVERVARATLKRGIWP
ncbi:MAG: glutamate dehydrogenase, partial [Pseudomonadota bacterium]